MYKTNNGKLENIPEGNKKQRIRNKQDPGVRDQGKRTWQNHTMEHYTAKQKGMQRLSMYKEKRSTGCTVSEESKIFNRVFTMLLFNEGNKNKYSYLLILQKNG